MHVDYTNVAQRYSLIYITSYIHTNILIIIISCTIIYPLQIY